MGNLRAVLLFMKYRDILLYRDNAGKYRIACDYPISPSSTLPPPPLHSRTCCTLGKDMVQNPISSEFSLIRTVFRILLLIQGHQLSLALVEFLSIILQQTATTSSITAKIHKRQIS